MNKFNFGKIILKPQTHTLLPAAAATVKDNWISNSDWIHIVHWIVNSKWFKIGNLIISKSIILVHITHDDGKGKERKGHCIHIIVIVKSHLKWSWDSRDETFS